MPETSKTTLLELSARYQAAGAESILQRYPNQKHFLLVLPSGESAPPVVWSSSNPLIISGRTTLTKIDINKNLENYAFPNAVIIPIQKSGRNEYPYICIGRQDGADIRLNSKKISKMHSAFYLREDGSLILQDLHSTNGTFINQMPSTENESYPVESWTEITFGDVKTLYTNFNDLVNLLKTAKIAA